MKNVLEKEPFWVLLLFLFSYVIYFYGAWALLQENVLGGIEVFFDADPSRTFANMVTGSVEPVRISPIVYPVVNLFVKLASGIAGAFFPETADTTQTQIFAGIMLFPIFGALRNVFMFYVFRTMGLTLPWVVLVSVLFAFGASNLVYGVVPDSYGISGMLLAALFLVTVRTIFSDFATLIWKWIAVGTLACGGLITHLFPLIITSFVAFLGNTGRYSKALWLSLVIACTSFALTLFLHGALYKVLPEAWILADKEEYLVTQSRLSGVPLDEYRDFWNPEGKVRPLVRTWWVETELSPAHPVRKAFHMLPEGNHIQAWLLRFDPVERFSIFPRAITASVTQSDVAVERAPFERPGPDQMLVFDAKMKRSPIEWFITILAALLLLGGAFRLATLSMEHRTLLAGAIGVIIYNWLFHSVWGGTQLFLYSQHWIVPLFVIIGGCFVVERDAKPDHTRILRIGAAACVLLLLVNNALWFQEVLTLLKNA